MDEDKLDVVVESMDMCTDSEGRPVFSSSYIYVNGELVDSNGNHMEAILRHLGYDAIVNYE